MLTIATLPWASKEQWLYFGIVSYYILFVILLSPALYRSQWLRHVLICYMAVGFLTYSSRRIPGY